MALNPKTRDKLERFIIRNSEEDVREFISFMRELGHAERLYAGEWMEELLQEFSKEQLEALRAEAAEAASA